MSFRSLVSTVPGRFVLEGERQVIAPTRLETAVVGHLVAQVEAVGDGPGLLVKQAVPQLQFGICSVQQDVFPGQLPFQYG